MYLFFPLLSINVHAYWLDILYVKICQAFHISYVWKIKKWKNVVENVIESILRNDESRTASIKICFTRYDHDRTICTRERKMLLFNLLYFFHFTLNLERVLKTFMRLTTVS